MKTETTFEDRKMQLANDQKKADDLGSSNESTIPKYALLTDRLREQILSGEFTAGDKLPTYAEMRSVYGATVATVERVYGALEREGLIERRQGSGTYVCERQVVSHKSIGYFGSAFSEHQRHIYSSHVIAGIHNALHARELSLLFMGGVRQWNRAALSKVDGVLLCNIDSPTLILRDLPPELPCVSLLTAPRGVASVVADDYHGAQQAVQHLLDLGHQRIGCLMEARPSLPRLRMAGYVDTLAAAGITVDPQWIIKAEDISYVPEMTRQPYLEWGREAMRAALRAGWLEIGCTAILVQNDLAAAGVMQALQEKGIVVPDQVSIIGFDGTEVCDFFVPRLTAVEVPLDKIGAKAVDVLQEHIAGTRREIETTLLPTRIRPGESTAPPP